jgi:hypothetical protein
VENNQAAKVGRSFLSSLQELSNETKLRKGQKKGHLQARKTLRKVINDSTRKTPGMQRLIEKYTGLRKMKANSRWTIHIRKKKKRHTVRECKEKCYEVLHIWRSKQMLTQQKRCFCKNN